MHSPSKFQRYSSQNYKKIPGTHMKTQSHRWPKKFQREIIQRRQHATSFTLYYRSMVQKQCGTCTKQTSRPKENNRRHICELLIWQRRQKHALGKNQLIQQMVVTKLDTNLQKTEHRSIYTTLPQIQLKPGHYLNLKLKHSNNGWFQHLSLTNGLVTQGGKTVQRNSGVE